MRGVQVNANGLATQGLVELSCHTGDKEREVRDGVGSGRKLLSGELGSRINEDANFANCEHEETHQPHVVQQIPQQQPQGLQGPVVRWERFLPLGSLKVLLVENDDSTRQVVSALLRNCSYEVSAVANGLEAWKILEDMTNHIDLVLAEVVMPGLSGIDLLCKIMSHKTCKNIPVILMSSNDSMDIVFKCLSKGAVDFLVKPIRKNELKNLWQHVWRKCHSSSGSGSESGIRAQRSSKSRSVEGSDNSMGSENDDDNTSNDLHFRDGSDNGSGTQSSWTKRAVEIESPQPMSPWDQLADPPDSTCAQVIHSMDEASRNNCVDTTAAKQCLGKDGVIGKDLEALVPRNLDLQLEDRINNASAALARDKKEKMSILETDKDGSMLGKNKLELESETPNGKLRKRVVDLSVAFTGCTDYQGQTLGTEVPDDISKKNIKGKTVHDSKEIPVVELSLKRLRDRDIETSAQERIVLRHSDLSAFSRYNTSSATNQAPTGNVGSCSPLDNSSEAAKTESMQNQQSNSNTNPNQRSIGSSNNNDMGSTTNNAFTKPAASSEKPIPRFAVNIRACSASQPIQNSHLSSFDFVVPEEAGAATTNPVLGQAGDKQSQVQVQHHHHHYHHHHHHVHNLQQQQQQQLPNHDDFSSRTIDAAAPHCGPSNVLSTPIEGNAANYSSNWSVSGSDNGSNRQNGSSTAVINEETNMATDYGGAGKCGGGSGGESGSGSGSRSGVDQNRSAQREAALNKFRQKRKERCFEKKVRYQSRKRLAEQRPRVRGQFVRQVEDRSKDRDC